MRRVESHDGGNETPGEKEEKRKIRERGRGKREERGEKRVKENE